MSISDSNNENNITIPQINIVSYKTLPITNLDKIENIILPENIIESEGFNSVLTKKRAQIYGFLSRHDSCIDNNTIFKILTVFKENPHINFVYSDVISVGENFRQPYYFPSTSSDLENKNIILLSPIFFRKAPILFNTKLKDLFFHHMILTLNHLSLGYHIPECLFITTKRRINQEELKIIYEQSSS